MINRLSGSTRAMATTTSTFRDVVREVSLVSRVEIDFPLAPQNGQRVAVDAKELIEKRVVIPIQDEVSHNLSKSSFSQVVSERCW